MLKTQANLAALAEPIINFIRELKKGGSDTNLLDYAELFSGGFVPSVNSSPAARMFYEAFVPEDGTQEEALVEYLAQLEDVVMEQRERAQPDSTEAKQHRLDEIEDAVLV